MTEKTKRRIDLPAITIGAILMAILEIGSIWMWNRLMPYTYGEWAWVAGPFYAMMIIVAVNALIVLVAPKVGLTHRQMTVIYSMLLTGAILWIIPYSMLGFLGNLMYSPSYRQDILGGGQWMPPLWAPTKPELITGMFETGPVPWNAWIAPMVWWIAFWAVIGVAQLFIAVFWRQQFVDIERLPFPFATVAMEVMRSGGVRGLEKPKNIFHRSAFWIGLLIGAVYGLPHGLQNWIPGFTAPAWYESWFNGVDFSGAVGYNICMFVRVNLAFVALHYLMPLEIQLSATLVWVICWVALPAIFVATDISPLNPSQTSGDAYMQGWNVPGNPYWTPQLRHGFWLGIPIALILINYSYIKRGLTGGSKSEKVVTEDICSQRSAFMYTVILFIVAFALLAAAGVPLIFSFVSPLLALTLYFTAMRLRAEAGGFSCYLWYGPWYQDSGMRIGAHMYLQAGTYASADNFRSIYMTFMPINDRVLYAATGPGAMESYKIAEGRVSPKELFVPQLIAIVLGLIIAYPLYIWGAYTYSIPYGWHAPDIGMWSEWFQYLMTGVAHRPMSVWWPWWIGGMLVAVLVGSLKVFFIWFPISMIGLIVGGHPMTGFQMAWSPAIALAAKYLTLKIWGTEAYERYAFPAAAGLFFGGLFFGELLWHMGYG